ncbi:MAG: glycosyltransferase family protein [Candidatus Humimicrobiaceae bacterium]
MIVATIITYNDWPLIQSCIESIVDKVDKIIAVDGAYDDFPNDINISTDGTLEYLNSIDKVEIIMAPSLCEVAKRNLYLEPLSEGDICLNIDADEVLIGEIPELKTDFGIVDWHDGHSKHIQRRVTKIFKYRLGMRYIHCHYTLYWNDQIVNKLNEVINKDFTSEYITSCHIIHNWHLRSSERQYYKSLYYKKLVQIEAGFIK